MRTDVDTTIVLSASTITGTPVVNRSGEDLGKLEELMIDLTTGRIAYAVLSFGGFLGLGNKLFAVPWEALRIDREEEVIIFDVDKRLLEDAPGFDKDDWPDTTRPEWLVDVYEYYGFHPYWG